MLFFSQGLQANRASNDGRTTASTLDEILAKVKGIEKDLGITAAPAVDPVGNFPYITDKHRSLACKALRKDPSLYAKYANVKTPMGFTFD